MFKAIFSRALEQLPFPLKIPECAPGTVGRFEWWAFSRCWRRYRSLRLYFWESFVSSQSGCFPLCLKKPSPFLKWIKKHKSTCSFVNWNVGRKCNRNVFFFVFFYEPLTSAAFTHFIAFPEKAGAVVTGDLLPRRDGTDHLDTSHVLLTGDELGVGWKKKKKGERNRAKDKQKRWEHTHGTCTQKETDGEKHIYLQNMRLGTSLFLEEFKKKKKKKGHFQYFHI